MESFGEKPRLRSLLDHFAVIEDPREPWRVAHPLPEVLLLVVCASIASCDDFDDIAAWGENHLVFLRRFLPYHHGVPGARWLNHPDEPHRSGPVLGLLHVLGARTAAGCAGSHRHRRQDLAPQPRPRRRQGAAASGLRLRHP